jgi:hypothetical protein
MSIFVFFRRLFSVLILPGDRAAQRKRSLARLYKEIKRRGPEWYRPWTDRVAPDFADKVEALRRSTVRMARVYALTIGTESGPAVKAETALLESLLKDGGLSLDAFSFDAIRAEAERNGKVDDLEAMDELLRKRLEVFGAEAMERAVHGYRDNLRIAALASFRWEDLLAPFGGRNGASARSSFPGAHLAPLLNDLYYLIAGFSVTREGREVFSRLRELSGIEGYGQAEERDDLKSLADCLAERCQPAALSRVIRAAYGDAELELREYSASRDFRLAERERILEEYGQRRRIMEDRMAAEKLESAKLALFGGTPLLQIHGYAADVSTSLQSSRLPSLDRVLPLSIVKSFLAGFFADRVRRPISLAVVQLDFQDIEFRTSLSDAADACMELEDVLGEFEQAAASPGREGLLGIVAAANGNPLDGADEISARRVVEGFNSRADKIVQAAFVRFAELSEALASLRSDLSSRSPKIVADAGAIYSRYPAIFSGIENAAELADKFLALLRSTAVDAGAAKRALEEAAKKGGLG